MEGLMIVSQLLLLICVIRLICYRNQIKELDRKLKYIRKNESNWLLPNDTHSKVINELSEDINKVLADYKSKSNTLKKREKVIKETITSLSHDIRTPITSLDGYFQLLLTTEDEEKRKNYIEVIRHRLGVTNDMLEELFTFAKLQNNVYHFELEKTCLNKLICRELLDFYEDFKRRGIEPVINIDEENVYALCNEKALKRVFHNVIKNALIHGTGDFRISMNRQEGKVLFMVANSCKWIDKLDLDRVFERFYMADQARTNDSTGLGLSIAKELVLEMNGTIRADIQDGRFIVEIGFLTC